MNSLIRLFAPSRVFGFVVLGLCSGLSAYSLPVFPGAVGFGADTPAGRGGQIVRVTNLLDDYQNPPEGSLRWAIEKVAGPRVIVFEVAGVIELRRNLMVRSNDAAGEHGYLTIAGQTAPYPGITLKNAGIVVAAQHVLIQHIAIRPGTLMRDEPGWNLTPPDNRDCLRVEAAAGITSGNLVVDHVTGTWATDETASTWSDNGNIRSVTFSNCIFAEPILNGGHAKGAHGYGPLSGRNVAGVTFARNLMAFNWARNPLVRDINSGAQIVNNFIYRPGVWSNTVVYLAGPGGMPQMLTNSVAGNVIIRHPVPFSVHMGKADGTIPLETYTTYYNTGIYAYDDLPVGARLFLDDNRLFNPQDSSWYPKNGDPWSSTIFRDNPVSPVVRLSSDPYAGSGGTNWAPWPSLEVESRVLASAGKFPAHRDPLDEALVAKVANREGTFVAFESDLGEDPWAAVRSEVRRPLVTPENPSGDDDGDGYTNLEEWLHQMAAAVESAVNRPPVAQAGPDQLVVVHEQPVANVALDGTQSFDYDGGDLTFFWSWPGGSATGSMPTIVLPVGTTVVTLTVTDPHGASASGAVTITVEDRPPVAVLKYLTLPYTGEPRPVTVATTPEHLPVDVRYNGSPQPPVYPGKYTVVAAVNAPGYHESVTGTLIVEPTVFVRHAPAIHGLVDGAVQMAQPESVTFNSQAVIASDLLLPGTPSLRINGSPIFGGTLDGPGAYAPVSHHVTLNPGATLRHLVRRVNAPAWPSVTTQPGSAGTRDVSLNAPGQSPGDFATLRNLTLNSAAGIVTVPPGNYGKFTANGGAGFRLGVAGTTIPAEYTLQGLTLNANSRVELAGPVVVTMAQGAIFNNAIMGDPARTGWLLLRFAAGGVTLNGDARIHGSVMAPNGNVTVNGTGSIHGRVTADWLTVGGSGAVRDPAEQDAPAVEITTPASLQTLSGRATVQAAATDASGIAGVRFAIDGVAIGSEDTLAPYEVEWDTLRVADGAHALTATARDIFGNSATTPPVAVVVKNAVFDTFEHGDGAGWTAEGAGTWSVISQDGNRVFRQSNATVVANRAFLTDSEWGDQRVEANVRLNASTGANRFFGVVTRYTTPNDYYYFVLRTNNTAELKRLKNGVAANIVPPLPLPFTVTPGVTYRLGLDVAGSRLRAYVNDQLVMEGSDESFGAGRAALLAFFSDVSFDDVHADPAPGTPVLVADNFETGPTPEWQPEAGSWNVETSGDSERLVLEGDGAGGRLVRPAMLGNATLCELNMRAIEFGDDPGRVGIAVRYQDTANHYSVTLRSDHNLVLEQVSDGAVTVLGSAPLPSAPGSRLDVKLHVVGDSFKIYIDGKLVIEAVDGSFVDGGVALLAVSARGEFDDLVVTAP